MWNRFLHWLTRFMNEALRWVRYIYFLRFSLLILGFPALIVALNGSGASSLIRGIIVPEYWEQHLCVGFFLVSSGFASLIVARAILLNGAQRFNEGIPGLLKEVLASDRGRWPMELLPVLVFQLPNVYAFYAMRETGRNEGVSADVVLWGLVAGAAVACLIWYSANAWFYLAYDAPDPVPPPVPVTLTLGKNAARTMLFPRAFFGLDRPGTPLAGRTATIELAQTALRDGRLHRAVRSVAGALDHIFKLTGYLYPDGTPFEGHLFAGVATAVFALISLVIWPLTAPVPVVTWSAVMLVALCAVAIVIVRIFWSANIPHSADRLRRWKWTLSVVAAIFVLAVFALYFLSASNRFPVFAMLILLVTLMFWSLGGIAFFTDRYRVPLLTLFIALIILPRILGVYGDSEEHYFSTVSDAPRIGEVKGTSSQDDVPSPAAILDARLPDLTAPQNAGADQPFFIVTATGGGLHASAWTSAVLAQLEMRFKRENIDFHKHVLLLSTVSGGSVGLLNYLREISEPAPDWVRMQASAQCSSLEAVGWGLIFYDAPKALIPLLPYALAPSPGENDLDTTPLGKDRTWALRTGFARNLDDRYCDLGRFDIASYFGLGDSWQKTPFYKTLSDALHARSQIRSLDRKLTLRSLPPTAEMPAFTMNTTTVEAGERFLLANYEIPQYALDPASDLPAQSFLDSIGCCRDRVYDLPLATAAQLSATFPLVSSAARAPARAEWHSVHFVDGGYYDNDGTVSAIEFLRHALAAPSSAAVPQECNLPRIQDREQCHMQRIQDKVSKLKKQKLRIVLIEIRNSPDPAAAGQAANQKAQSECGGRGAENTAWSVFSQLLAPLKGFWNAGHEAVTGRNQAALSLLEQALQDRLQVHRIVFDDRNSQDEVGTDPLSWSLTPKERAEVLSSSCPRKMSGKYDEAVYWYKLDADRWQSDTYAPAPSTPSESQTIQEAPPQIAGVAQPAKQ